MHLIKIVCRLPEVLQATVWILVTVGEISQRCRRIIQTRLAPMTKVCYRLGLIVARING
jgi:hypothetical protein